MTPNATAAARRTHSSGTTRSSARPPTIASPATTHNASSAPMKTAPGSPYFAAKDAVSTCDRSPHSAANSTPKLVRAARRNVGAGGASASSSVTSRSSSAAPGPLRSMRTAPVANAGPATACPGRPGSSETRPPATTATVVCTTNAAATPTNTGHGANRVDSTSVATNVLSGSSAGKISAKTVRATVTDMSAEPAHRGGRGCRKHRLRRPVEPVSRSDDVLPLRRHVDHLPVQPRDLHVHLLTVNGDRHPVAVERCLAHGGRADADRRALAEQRGAYRVDAGATRQRAERVRGSPLLHEDRRHPGVGCAGGKQPVDHLRPQPGIKVVDVRLHEQPLILGRRLSADAVTDDDPDDVGSVREVAGAGADTADGGPQPWHRPGRRRELREQRDAGRSGELDLDRATHGSEVGARKQLDDGRRWHRERAVCRVDRTATQRDRRRDDMTDVQLVQRGADTDDVDDRVHRADLVEV